MPETETNKAAGAVIAEKHDVKALLETANSASERVAGLHVAFMAVCVYVLVIVFGTTDLDLLMGKGVRLPVVNVDVPIVGFYAFAPYLVVLAHFNLLLQLQLLSRKLFAFDAAAPQEDGIGGLRDRLHIFPYTYYLVGRPSPLVQPLIGLMVSITLVLLPLVTLLALQLQFLAYQDEAVTWWQRLAIWLDVAVIAMLWPVILHPKDDWYDYWHGIIAAHVPRRRVWIVPVLILLGLFLFSFSAATPFGPYEGGLILFFTGFVSLLLSLPLLIVLSGWKSTQRNRRNYLLWLFLLASGAVFAIIKLDLQKPLFPAIPWLVVPVAVFWHPRAPRGSLALLLTLYVGALLPLVLHVEGEGIERMVLRAQGMPHGSTLLSMLLREKRRLDLDEQILLSKPANTETLALVRSGDWHRALMQIEPINLHGRNLRNASMNAVILVSADLRGAQLQGVELQAAHLQNADLKWAQLQDADLFHARLQGADLRFSMLQGVKLHEAKLQGADLRGAQLQGAGLYKTQLQGANLRSAQLQGADLRGTQLQGADLEGAELQGADLSEANLEGASLKNAKLYTAVTDTKTLSGLIDARSITWAPVGEESKSRLTADLQKAIKETDKLKQVTDRLQRTTRLRSPELHVQSCFARKEAPLVCATRFDPENPVQVQEFTGKLHAKLTKLACESPDIARGIIRQIPDKKGSGSSREGLNFELKRFLDHEFCRGLHGLSAEEKKNLR